MSFSSQLIDWYLVNKRDLPWRSTNDAYKIWLSEIMLQQTRVAQGLSYYYAFEKEFPTIFDLAAADEQLVLKLWQGLGYYSRARNLHYTAKYIVEHYDGTFPSEFSEIKKLKGVGDYTASAIASIAFQKPHAVVDGNVYRVLARVFGIETPINSTEGIKEFKSLAQSLIDKKNPGTYNQAIMEFGAMQCKPKNPDCNVCPLQNICVAFQNKSVDALPVKLQKTKVRKRYFNYIVVLTDDRKTILQQRTSKGIWQNLFEFPLVETNSEVDEKKLKSTKQFQSFEFERFEISLFNVDPIIHKLSHQHLHTKFWILETPALHKANIKWEEIQKYPVPILIANFLNRFTIS